MNSYKILHRQLKFRFKCYSHRPVTQQFETFDAKFWHDNGSIVPIFSDKTYQDSPDVLL